MNKSHPDFTDSKDIEDYFTAVGKAVAEACREAHKNSTGLPVVPREPEGGPAVFLLPLSEYEVVNLHEALKAAHEGGSPICAINTGDWCGVLRWILQQQIERFGIKYGPNQTAEEMTKRAKAYSTPRPTIISN